MVRARAHLAAGAIAAALLLPGAGGAVAAADPTTDSAGSENANNTSSDSGSAPSGHSADNSASSSSDGAKPAGDQAENAAQSNGGDAKAPAREKSADAQPEEELPVDHDSGSSDCSDCRTINKVLLPEAPPAVDLGPPPEAPPAVDLGPPPEAPLAPALETPPPADLPPAIPATPVDPDTVDAAAGEAGHHSGGDAPPVLTAPVLVAPAPPAPILGASIASRWSMGERAVDPAPQWVGGSSPPLIRASSAERPLHEPSVTNFGLTPRGQTPYRTGYDAYVPRSLADIAAKALPGLAGLVMMTASGICLGYRQANTAQLLRIDGIDRLVT
jgi:hypothetical protein